MIEPNNTNLFRVKACAGHHDNAASACSAEGARSGEWRADIAPADAPCSQSERPQRLRRILAVDDEPDILYVVAISLEGENFEVQTARDGRRALECVTQLRPDLIIMDVVMPGMGGFAALRTLKEDPATENIPVIMLTARDSEADVLGGWLRGADLYMTKPFEIRQLVANVHTIFRDLDRSDEDYLLPPLAD